MTGVRLDHGLRCRPKGAERPEDDTGRAVDQEGALSLRSEMQEPGRAVLAPAATCWSAGARLSWSPGARSGRVGTTEASGGGSRMSRPPGVGAQTGRESQRKPEKARESQRKPEKARESQRKPEKARESQRKPEYWTYYATLHPSSYRSGGASPPNPPARSVAASENRRDPCTVPRLRRSVPGLRPFPEGSFWT